eukprot:COSAG02_NODE_2704_length_8197_cov_2.646085_5_plen_657_part_00
MDAALELVSEERRRRQRVESELEELRRANEEAERQLAQTRERIATAAAIASPDGVVDAVRLGGRGELLCQFEAKGPWLLVSAIASADGMFALQVERDWSRHSLSFFPLKWAHSDHGALPDGGVCRACAKRKYTKYCTQCFLCASCAGLRPEMDCESSWTAVSEWGFGCGHVVTPLALSAETVEHPFAFSVQLGAPDSRGWSVYRLDPRTAEMRTAWQRRLQMLARCTRKVEQPLFMQYHTLTMQLGRTSSAGSSDGRGDGNSSLRLSGNSTGSGLTSLASGSSVVSSEFATPRDEPSDEQQEETPAEEGEPPEPTLCPTLSSESSGSEEFEMARGISVFEGAGRLSMRLSMTQAEADIEATAEEAQRLQQEEAARAVELQRVLNRHSARATSSVGDRNANTNTSQPEPEPEPLPTHYTNPNGTIELSATQVSAYERLLVLVAADPELSSSSSAWQGHLACRWLAANDWVAEATLERIRTNFEWRASTFPIPPQAMAMARDSKLGDPVNVVGQAMDGSICVVIRAQRFPTPTDGTLVAVQALVTHVIESALNQVPGGMGSPDAQLSVVYDRTNSPSIWVEVDYFKAIGAVLEANYPETLKRAFLFPTGGAFRFGWRMVQAFLDDDTRSKLVLCTEHDLEVQLARHIDPAVLQATDLG